MGASVRAAVGLGTRRLWSVVEWRCLSQHYLHELVIRTLVQHSLFSTLHQFLQYHVLSDSKPLVSPGQWDLPGDPVA